MKGYVVVVPFREDLLGKDITNVQDPNGMHLFQEMNSILDANDGEGSLEWAWTKPSDTEPSRKVGSFKLYEPWGWVVGTGIYVDDAEEQMGALWRQVFLILLFALVAAAGLVVWVATRLRRPIAELEAAAERVIGGELDTRVAAGADDEVGRLASSFNEMVVTVRQSLAESEEKGCQAEAAKAEAGQREAEAQQAYLTRTAQTMLEGMKRFEQSDLTVHLKIERDDLIDELYVGSDCAVENLRTMIDRVGGAVEATASASTQISASTEQLSVAAQEQSAQSQEVAAEMIRSVQSGTEAAVTSMCEGNEEVEEGIALANRAGEALQRIVAGTDKAIDMVAQIAAASEERSTTSEQMARSVEMISTVSGESAQGLSQIAQSTDGLNRLTEKLRELVGRFCTGTGTAAPPTLGGDGHTQAPAPPRPVVGCPVHHA